MPPGHPHRRPRPPAAEKMEPEREREEAQAGALASLPVAETPVGGVGGSREAEGSKTSGTFCNR